MSSESNDKQIHKNDDNLEKSLSKRRENESFGLPIDKSLASTPSPSPKSTKSSEPKCSSPVLASTSGLSLRIKSKPSELKINWGESLMKIFIPVSICMSIVVLMVKFVCRDQCQHSTITTYYLPVKEDKSSSYGDQAIASIVNALVFVAFMAMATFLLAILFIIRCYKVILGILIVQISLLLFTITYMTVEKICQEFNIPVDCPTIYLYLWNYGILGLLCIFWKGPLILQQSYLIMNSVLVSIKLMEILPEWTTWILLITLAIWDLFAVLSPLGPLRLLIETIKRRNEEEGEKVGFPPGMIYTTIIWTLIANYVMTAAKKDYKEEKTNNTENKDDEQELYKPKLGLGDFIFYSILVGKASVYSDWNITFGCCVGILVGLGLTLLLLAIFEKALPALPISILFGVSIFIIIKFSVTPFLDQLNLKQIYI